MFTYLKFADSHIANATLTPDTEDALYPVENVQAEPAAETYRSTSASAQKILIDYAAPVLAGQFLLINHNLTSAATITLRGGSSQDPDGLDFEVVIPWATRNAWVLFDALETWRYWSLTIDDASNPDGVLEMGLLLHGLKWQLTRNFNLASERRSETVNQALESEFGVITTGQNLYQRTRFVATWKTTTDAERLALAEFLARLEKERGGLAWIPDPDETVAYYGRLVTDHSEVRRFAHITDFSGLELLEDSTGRSLF